MADTLIRETAPPAGAPASPVPQVWNPATSSYEKVEGSEGAPKMRADDGKIATLGAKADAAVTDPTLSASEIALLKGLLKQLQGTGPVVTPVSLNGRNAANDPVAARLTDGTNFISTSNRLPVSIDGETFFVDGAAGSDSNPGTVASPLKTIGAAVNKPTAAVVAVRPGIYRETLNITKPLTLIGLTPYNWGTSHIGVDLRGSFRMTEWSLYSGNTYYKDVTGYAPYTIYVEDMLDANGNWTALTYRASIAEVEANPGSWYYDSGTKLLYIQLPDRSNPALHLIELVNRSYGIDIKPGCTYFRAVGITITGFMARGVRAMQRTDGQDIVVSELIFEQCYARYIRRSDGTTDGIGFATDGPMRTRFYGCKAYGNGVDGFNFHHGGRHELYDCEAYHNLDDGVSPHEGAYLYVRGGHFFNNAKGNLIAVYNAIMVCENVRTTGAGQYGFYYGGSTGRISRALCQGNNFGLVLSGSFVTLDGVSYGTGNTTNESIDATSAKFVIS